MNNRVVLTCASAMLIAGFSTNALAQATLAPTAPAATTPAVTPVAAVAPVAAQSSAATVVLPANSTIAFITETTLSSDKRDRVKGEPKPPKGKNHITNPGDVIFLSVASDVKVGDTIVVPRGARGMAEVLSVSNRGGFGKSGKIEVAMRSLEVNGTKYKMQGVFFQKGKSRGGAAVAGVIIAGVIAGVFIKGDEAYLAQGSDMSFQTLEAIPSAR